MLLSIRRSLAIRLAVLILVYLLVVVGHGMMCNLSLVLYHLLLSGLEALMLNGSTSVLLSIRRSLAIRLAVLILVYLLVVIGHGMMCSLSLVLYHLFVSAPEALTLHGNTSVLLNIRWSLAIRLAVLVLVYLLVVVGQGMMCNLSLVLYLLLLSGLEALMLNGSTSMLLSIRRSLAIRLAVLILVYLLVVIGHGMMCNFSLVLYHLLLSALETLTLHGNTSVLLNIN